MRAISLTAKTTHEKKENKKLTFSLTTSIYSFFVMASMQARFSLCVMQCMCTRLGQLCSSRVPTPVLRPVITEAPSLLVMFMSPAVLVGQSVDPTMTNADDGGWCRRRDVTMSSDKMVPDRNSSSTAGYSASSPLDVYFGWLLFGSRTDSILLLSCCSY